MLSPPSRQPPLHFSSMLDLIRESPFGQLLNRVSNGRVLPYKEQQSTYQIPARYLKNGLQKSHSRDSSVSVATIVAPVLTDSKSPGSDDTTKLEAGDLTFSPSPTLSVGDEYLVDWEGVDDPENPL